MLEMAAELGYWCLHVLLQPAEIEDGTLEPPPEMVEEALDMEWWEELELQLEAEQLMEEIGELGIGEPANIVFIYSQHEQRTLCASFSRDPWAT